METKIRPFKLETDYNFVIHSMLECLHTNSWFAKNIRAEDFFPHHRSIVQGILASPDLVGLISCHPEDEDQIFGYLIGEKENIIHFVYVKKPFRNLGFARDLLKATGFDTQDLTFTHWTFLVNQLVMKFDQIRYNPYLALKKGTHGA